MKTNETMEERRLNLIQDTIDRMLYLPEDKINDYENEHKILSKNYPIPMKIINDVRVYTFENQQ